MENIMYMILVLMVILLCLIIWLINYIININKVINSYNKEIKSNIWNLSERVKLLTQIANNYYETVNEGIIEIENKMSTKFNVVKRLINKRNKKHNKK